MEFTMSNLHNSITNSVQKSPVMRDGENGPGVPFKLVLKPAQGFQIEMVRRFVEH